MVRCTNIIYTISNLNMYVHRQSEMGDRVYEHSIKVRAFVLINRNLSRTLQYWPTIIAPMHSPKGECKVTRGGECILQPLNANCWWPLRWVIIPRCVGGFAEEKLPASLANKICVSSHVYKVYYTWKLV